MWNLCPALVLLFLFAVLAYRHRDSHSKAVGTYAILGARQVLPYTLNDALALQITDACARREETYIWIDNKGRAMVSSLHPEQSSRCPLLDIMLGTKERGFGMCMDAALYVLLAGARIVPTSAAAEPAHSTGCGAATARLFMEVMYEQLLLLPGALNVMLVNHENLYGYDAYLHQQMHVFLCKTRICVSLMQQYVARKNYTATVLFVSHTSADPLRHLVGSGSSSSSSGHREKGRGRNRRVAPVQDFNKFIHVRGKSSLKHTREVLECWAGRPELPLLTVVGPVPNLQISGPDARRYRAAANVRIIGEPPARWDDEYVLLPSQQLHLLAAEHGVHVCPSEREGFGHYINEARALGALILTPDHPPMNELVTPDTGVMIRPVGAFSNELAALGGLANISARISPGSMCDAVDRTLALPIAERRARGTVVRAAYHSDRREFVTKHMPRLRAWLAVRLPNAETA